MVHHPVSMSQPQVPIEGDINEDENAKTPPGRLRSFSQREGRRRSFSQGRSGSVSKKKRKHEADISVIELDELSLLQVVELVKTLNSTVSSLKEEIKEMRLELLKNQSPADNNKLDKILTQVEKWSSEKEKSATKSTSTERQGVTTTENEHYTFFSDLNKRRKAFYTYLHNNDRVALFNDWQNQNPPNLPAKYIPVEIENEPPEEYKCRLDFTKAKLKCDMDIMRSRAKNAKEEYEQIDTKVVAEIYSSHEDQEEINKNVEIWTKKIEEEEKKSKDIWNVKREKLVKVPEKQRENGKVVIKDRSYASVVTQNSENDMHVEEEQFQVVVRKRNGKKPTVKKNQTPPADTDTTTNNTATTSNDKSKNQKPHNRYWNNNQNKNHGYHSDSNQNFNSSSGRGGTQQNFRRRGYPQRGRSYWSYPPRDRWY